MSQVALAWSVGPGALWMECCLWLLGDALATAVCLLTEYTPRNLILNKSRPDTLLELCPNNYVQLIREDCSFNHRRFARLIPLSSCVSKPVEADSVL
jgi:hypothetical protein